VDLMYGIYQFNNRGEMNMEQMVNYFNQNGITQSEIAEKFQISLRQIRNYLNKQ